MGYLRHFLFVLCLFDYSTWKIIQLYQQECGAKAQNSRKARDAAYPFWLEGIHERKSKETTKEYAKKNKNKKKKDLKQFVCVRISSERCRARASHHQVMRTILKHGREVHHRDQRQMMRPSGQPRSKNRRIRAEMMMMLICHPWMNRWM